MGDEYYNEEFRLLVEHDIEQFQKQLCNANAKDKRILLFPRLNSFRRYLIHQTCGKFPDLATVSVGQDLDRRVIIYPRSDFPHIPTVYETRKQKYSHRYAQSSSTASAACGSNQITHSDNNQASIQFWRHNSSRSSSEFDTSTDSATDASTEPVTASKMGIKEHESVAKTIKPFNEEICTPACSDEPSHSDPSVIQQSYRQRNRRPDRQVYVPRGRRSQPAPPETAQNQSTEPTSPQSVSNTVSSITEPLNTLELTTPVDCTTSTVITRTATESVTSIEPTKCIESTIKSTTVTVRNKENTKNTDSSKHKEHSKSAESNKKTVAVKITDNPRSAESAKCIEPIKPVETTKTVDAIKTVEATKRIESVNSTTSVISNKHPTTIANSQCSNSNQPINSNDTKAIAERKIHAKSVSPNPKIDTRSPPVVESSLKMSDTHIKSDSEAMNTHDKDVCEEKELQRASKEMNRSNRRIIKQTFDSNVLEISETRAEPKQTSSVQSPKLDLPQSPPQTVQPKKTPQSRAGDAKETVDKVKESGDKHKRSSSDKVKESTGRVKESTEKVKESGKAKESTEKVKESGRGRESDTKARKSTEKSTEKVKKSVNPETDDWESMFDEEGECLDPKLMDEISATMGKVAIAKPKSEYKTYQEPVNLDDEEFPHVLEVSSFPSEFKTQDLMMLFAEYKESGFDIKWVDDTHALVVFSSSKIAAQALGQASTFIKLKPLTKATAESRSKAKKSALFLQPYRQRPETCAALARRLVTGALGVRLSTAREEREAERAVLQRAKERKMLAAKQREEAWENE